MTVCACVRCESPKWVLLEGNAYSVAVCVTSSVCVLCASVCVCACLWDTCLTLRLVEPANGKTAEASFSPSREPGYPGSLYKMTFKGPFQPKPFYDSTPGHRGGHKWLGRRVLGWGSWSQWPFLIVLNSLQA